MNSSDFTDADLTNSDLRGTRIPKDAANTINPASDRTR